MNKKLALSSLLVLPLLLSGCGGGAKPGNRGEDVLTREQKESLFATRQTKYTYTEGLLAGSYHTQKEGYAIASVVTGFYAFHKDDAGVEDWYIISDFAGEIAAFQKASDYTVVEPFQMTNTTLQGSYTGDSTKYVSYRATFEKGEEKKVVNEVKDMFGNSIYSGKLPYSEEHVTKLTRREVANKVSYNGESEIMYLLDVEVTNYVEGTEVTTYTLKYGEGFKSIAKYEEPGESALNPFSVYKFAFTYKDVKYSLLENGSGYDIVHENKDGTKVTEKFVTPDGRGQFLDHYYVYQTDNEVNKHNENHNYYSRDGKVHQLNTYRIDLVDMEQEEIDFPYYVEDNFYVGLWYEEQMKTKGVEELTLTQYAAVTLTKIEDGMFVGQSEVYVVDANLVLHDNLSNYLNGYVAFGNDHYYRTYGGIGIYIYDKDFNVVSSLKRYTLSTDYSGENFLVIRNTTNRYGVIGEDGKFIIEPRFNAPVKSSVFSVYSFRDGDEMVYFHTDTLAVERVVYKEDTDYETILGEECFYVKRGAENPDTSEFADDEIYYLNTKLLSAKHFTGSVTQIASYVVTYGKVQYKYRSLSFENADGGASLFTVQSVRNEVQAEA